MLHLDAADTYGGAWGILRESPDGVGWILPTTTTIDDDERDRDDDAEAPRDPDEVPLPAAARNHSETSVWQPAKPSVGRPEPELRDWLWRVGLAQSKVDWQQRLHPYVAPMYRLKSGMVLVEKGSPEGPPL